MSSLLIRHVPPRAAVAVAALAVLASLLAGREKPNLALAHAGDSARALQAIAVGLDPVQLKRPAPQHERAVPDIFAAPQPVAVAVAAPAHQAKPAAPSAPALPFRYVGRSTEEGRVAVFLEKGRENYSVAQGEQAGRYYRIERITDASITFTYLPLGERQTLPVPALN